MASIKKNMVYSGLLTAANYVFPLVTYPYVARVIGVDNIGLVNFVDSLVNYFVIVSMMGMAVLGVREVAAAAGDKGRLSRRFCALLSLNAVTTAIALALYAVTCALVDALRDHPHLMAFGALKIVFSAMLVEWLYRGIEDFRYITVRSVCVRLAYVAAVFGFVRSADDYATYYLLTILMIGVNGGVNLWHSRRLVAWRFPAAWRDVRMCVKPMLLLGLYTMLTAMYTTFNVTFLGFECGDHEVGYYTTALKLFTIIIAFYSAMTSVMMPRMSSLLSDGRQEEARTYLRRSVGVLISAAMPLAIATLVLAPDIIWAIAGPGYEGAVTPLRVIAPLIFVVGYEQILVVQTLMPRRCDKVVLRNAAIGAAAAVALNVAVVPKGMAVGAAAVWVACEVCVMALSQRAVGRRFAMPFPWRPLLRAVACCAPLAALLAAAAWCIGSPMARLLAGGAICGAFYLTIEGPKAFFVDKGW